MLTRFLPSILLAASLPLAGCGDQAASPQSANDSQPPAWVLASAPEGAIEVTDAKQSAAEGDQIVLRARIGGRKAPISDDSPVFTVMDLSIPHCGEIPGDSCGMPWDYCCETPESIAANAATVRVVAAEGEPITRDANAHGLSPLDEVIVVGTVAARPDQKVLTINASGVYRVTEGG